MGLTLIKKLVGIGLALWTPLAAAAEAGEASRAETLILGRISSKATQQYPKLEALNNYVVRRLEGTSIKAGNVVIARDINHMAQLLREDAVDYFSETAYTALRLEKMGLAEIVLKEWKDGASTYTSVILARQSDLSSLNELRGGRIMFEDPDSTSGFFLPYVFLLEHGFILKPASATGNAAEPGITTYEFAGGETTIMGRIVRRHADAGVVSSTDWNSQNDIPEPFRKNLKPIAETSPAPRSLMLVRHNLDAAIRLNLIDILRAMHKQPDTAEILDSYFDVAKFKPLSDMDKKQIHALRAAIDMNVAVTP